MMLIKRNDKEIEMAGHAEDKIPCAMLTALFVSLLQNITERLKEDIDCHIDKGTFYLDLTQLSTDAMVIVDSFWYSIKKLAHDYPASFRIGMDTTKTI